MTKLVMIKVPLTNMSFFFQFEMAMFDWSPFLFHFSFVTFEFFSVVEQRLPPSAQVLEIL